MDKRHICIVGAGPSGLASIKILQEAGLEDIVCFETQNDVGGNWLFSEKPGHGGVYETTHLVSSKTLSGFSDYPMPQDFPDYPSHRQVLEFHRGYAAKFNLRDKIEFRTRVNRIMPDGKGNWKVSTSTTNERRTWQFEHIIVCSGHHWAPYIPDCAGNFSGTQIHSCSYRRSDPYRGRKVLVVGAGNSACDIACAISQRARYTAISIRSPQYIFPKSIFGRPSDKQHRKLAALPDKLVNKIAEVALYFSVGPYRRYGLRKPKIGFQTMHPTMNSEIFERISHGNLKVLPGPARLDDRQVHFSNGAVEEFDTIIWATGYRNSFPFLEDDLLGFDPNEELPLYKLIVPKHHRGLYFVGLIQPFGCIWTLAEIQARYVSDLIAGRSKLPSNLEGHIRREMATRKRKFAAGRRHLCEVIGHVYAKDLSSLLSDNQRKLI